MIAAFPDFINSLSCGTGLGRRSSPKLLLCADISLLTNRRPICYHSKQEHMFVSGRGSGDAILLYSVESTMPFLPALQWLEEAGHARIIARIGQRRRPERRLLGAIAVAAQHD